MLVFCLKSGSYCVQLIQVGRDHNTAVLSTPMTKSLSLQQIVNIQEKRTETDIKELRVQYGLSEHHNPLFNIPADLYRYKINVYRIAMITRQFSMQQTVEQSTVH